jgi:signal transduction histidine kinase
LSSTSHELRTPLNSVLGFAQLIQMSESRQLMAPIAAERSIRITTDRVHPPLAVYADRQRRAPAGAGLSSPAVLRLL